MVYSRLQTMNANLPSIGVGVKACKISWKRRLCMERRHRVEVICICFARARQDMLQLQQQQQTMYTMQNWSGVKACKISQKRCLCLEG